MLINTSKYTEISRNTLCILFQADAFKVNKFKNWQEGIYKEKMKFSTYKKHWSLFSVHPSCYVQITSLSIDNK